MFRAIRCLARSLVRARSGNATMMVGLGLPALIGAMGYGVDTAQWYMWQRELQHSVDQAAIGGAWALAYDEAADYSTRARQEYYANQDLTTGFASAPRIALAGYQGGANNSVLVTATATRELPFTGMLLHRTVTVAARAQAMFKEGTRFSACLITLKEDGTTFQIGGSATVIANCGLGALSCSPDAIVIDGSATVETTSIAACGTVSVPEQLESTVSEGATVSDVYKDTPIPVPDAGTIDRTKSKYCEGNGNKAIATLKEGIYTGGYTAKCATTFEPGVYFIDGGTLDLSTNDAVIGQNVLFVLRNGAEIKLGGEGGTGSIALTPMGSTIKTTNAAYLANADRLSQMLFIEDKGDETEPASHQINGNSNLSIQGIFYLPNGDVQINGTSDTESELCFQISAYTLDIRGNAYLKTLCEVDETSELGSTAAGVRLIA
jgi:Flp pilus assembly protein TadG